MALTTMSLHIILDWPIACLPAKFQLLIMHCRSLEHEDGSSPVALVWAGSHDTVHLCFGEDVYITRNEESLWWGFLVDHGMTV